MRNSQRRSLLANRRVHGIDIETNTMRNKIIQNCVLNSLNDSIIGTTNNRMVVTGNTSFNTNPNPSGRSVDLQGTGKMVYVGNYWDVPPTGFFKSFQTETDGRRVAHTCPTLTNVGLMQKLVRQFRLSRDTLALARKPSFV